MLLIAEIDKDMKDNDCIKYRFALPLRQQLREADSPATATAQAARGGTTLNGDDAKNDPPIRQGILIHLRSSAGFEGWGQAMPHNGILTDANEAAVAEVALDAASCDLASQQADIPLCDWLRLEGGDDPSGGDGNISDANDASDIADAAKVLNSPAATQPSPKAIPVNALILGATPEEVSEAGKLAAVSGFPAVKLKVGGGELRSDIARVRALREAVGNEVAIRLDANGAWQPQEALQALHNLAPFDIEYAEEPTAGLAAIAELASQSPIALAADESVKSVSDLSRLPRLGIPVAVIKPAVLGNLKHLLAACRELVSEGVKVTVSSAMDSSIGIACAAHFAAALGLTNTPCGLATADCLAEDLAPPLQIAEGSILLPRTPGLGIAPAPEVLKNLRSGSQDDSKSHHMH